MLHQVVIEDPKTPWLHQEHLAISIYHSGSSTGGKVIELVSPRFLWPVLGSHEHHMTFLFIYGIP